MLTLKYPIAACIVKPPASILGASSGLTTIFYGSISTLSVRSTGGDPGLQSLVNGVPEPSTFSLLALALIGMAVTSISRRTHASD